MKKFIFRIGMMLVILDSIKTISSSRRIIFGEFGEPSRFEFISEPLRRSGTIEDIEQDKKDARYLDMMCRDTSDLRAIQNKEPQEVVDQHRQVLAQKLREEGFNLLILNRLLQRVKRENDFLAVHPGVRLYSKIPDNHLLRLQEMMPYLSFPLKPVQKESREQESLFRSIVNRAYLLHLNGDSELLKHLLGIGQDGWSQQMLYPSVINRVKNLFEPEGLSEILRTLAPS